MSDFFNGQRFGRLLRAHWAEQYRSTVWFFGMCAIVFLVLSLLLFSTAGYHGFEHGAQMACFYGGLFVTGGIYAARYFDGVARKETALLILMRPASTFEKWLLAAIVVLVLYPLAYTLVYTLLNAPLVWIAKAQALAESLREPEMHSYYKPEQYDLFVPFLSKGEDRWSLPERALVQSLILVVFACVQGYCVASSLYFKKNAMLKMVLVAFLLTIIYALFCAVTKSNPAAIAMVWAASFGETHEAMRMQDKVMAFGLWFATPVLLWTCAYFHLKEREVA
jgi:hypothetical protein